MHLHRCFATILVLVATASFALGAEPPRFEIDPKADLKELAKTTDTNRLPVDVQSEGNVHSVDCSAVLSASPSKLYAAAGDYGNYVKFGMPDLLESVVLPGATPELLFTWSHMLVLGKRSKHFLEIHRFASLAAAGSSGISWERVAKRPEWAQPDEPGFDQFTGSWYQQPLPDGGIYVRYFMNAKIRTLLPAPLLKTIIEGKLKSNVRAAIRILADQAKP